MPQHHQESAVQQEALRVDKEAKQVGKMLPVYLVCDSYGRSWPVMLTTLNGGISMTP